MKRIVLGLIAFALLAGCYAREAHAACSYPTSTVAAVTACPSLVTLQGVIAVTGTAVQLGTNSLNNGMVCLAKTANAAALVVGMSGVANTVNGTGTGLILPAGGSVSLAVNNSNLVYINGTSGDIISCAGN